ncbi:MAG: bifunctional phosphopantothenoylcysteine decarboxylase/phosphopantothenate--cysteine ligase CoaBC [Dehalococcoidia bacterium]|nr:bifunctional phosphopantothenoylcysteine decarboxylase/phosphopantothenate--cysteine ligase CoaBC [Dehalococcoidia bacterium]
MTYSLQGKTISLGVTGSIACYKAVDLASKLMQLNADVDVLMTPSALRFLTPLTFTAITHRPVITSMFDPQSELSINHVAAAERADLVAVVPATANSLAKIAHGRADDPVSATILATRAPVLVAPAMDANMFESPATQANVELLRQRGIYVAGPAEGRMASGLVGRGRLLEPAELVGHIRILLGRAGDLAGRKIVVSAGGTREAIDPVRVIANHSSGKMGYAIAEAARDRGAQAVIVSAPTALPDPTGVKVARINSALEMGHALDSECADADAIIMAAAVADWRVAEIADQKVKKTGADSWTIDLVKNPDLIAGIHADKLVKVGFAAESEDLIDNARSKIQSKGLHMIVANDITAEDAGFAVDDNRVIILDREGSIERLPLMSKYNVGVEILDRVIPLLNRPA